MVSENSSKQTKTLLFAAGLLAAIFAVFFLSASAEAGVKINNLPEWQRQLADRSISAVYDELSGINDTSYKSQVLKTVAEKIFTGYTVSASINGGKDIELSFEADKYSEEWHIKLNTPTLQEPALKWFEEDIKGLEGDVLSLLAGVPLASLSWSDSALLDAIKKNTAERIPGWTPSLLLNTKESGSWQMNISFAPSMPMVLAVNPVLTSSSLPSVLHNRLKKELLGEVSPFIGLPVAWITKHKNDINGWAENLVNENKVTRWSDSESEAAIVPAQVAPLKVKVESKNYTIGAWAAVYAGTSEKAAELGIHLGRKVELIKNFDMEPYFEGILALNDWKMNCRLGLRFRPIKNFWLGGEWDKNDDLWWGKISMDPQLRRFYFWARVREDGIFNGALGWRATENISFELEYDERYEDHIALKLLGNL